MIPPSIASFPNCSGEKNHPSHHKGKATKFCETKMIRRAPLVKLALVAVCLAFSGSPVAAEEIAASQSMYGDTTREQILATRERRKNQLKIMVVDAENKLADHASGENILTEEEKTRLETQIDLFQRKIESMHVELEDWVSISYG